MSHIFISYSREDSACVLKVARRLEGLGYKVWLDVLSIPGGESWAGEIRRGLIDAPVTLVFWSPKAAASYYVRQEFEMALQKQMEKPSDDRRVIPVLLNGASPSTLPSELIGINAIPMPNCSKAEIDNLVRAIGNFKTREMLSFDANKPLGAHPNAAPLGLSDVVSVPFMQSIYTNASIIGPKNVRLADIRNMSEPTAQVYLQFLGEAGDEQAIKQIYQVIEKNNVERAKAEQTPLPFFLLHVTGFLPPGSSKYRLDDAEQGFWQGQWLDAVNTCCEAIINLKISGTGTIQLFNALPASLNFAIGMKLFKYWHFQIFHYTHDRRYQLVMDTNDLDLER